MKFDWEALEKAGHDFTIVSGMIAGTSTYYCENCGTLMLVRGLGSEAAIFHVPRHTTSTMETCLGIISLGEDQPRYETLKSKLEELQRQDYERLKDI